MPRAFSTSLRAGAPEATSSTFAANASTSGFAIASQSIQCGFACASAVFVEIFIVGTTVPNGVPRPVVNSTRWQPLAASTVDATRSLPGPVRSERPCAFTCSP